MKKGFTLIELLVVIAIIGILSSVVLASLSKSNKGEETNYKIIHQGNWYYAESYTKENNGRCLYLGEQEIRLCGDYTIQKLNKNN